MKKIIVYGVGENYKKVKGYLETKFVVIGYSDSIHSNETGYIEPQNIGKYDYDYICITSTKHFDEIKAKLAELLGDDSGDRIISIYDILGDFRNEEVRDKWVIDHLSRLSSGKILLDAGAGEQKYEPYCRHLKYIAQDFGEYVPNDIMAGLQSNSWDYSGLNMQCDIIDMPLDNEAIDVILCTEVFEHLKNPILALKEFSRVLKPGGTLILTAPCSCLTHMAPYFYYNGFSEYWYREHLYDNGFEIKEFVSNGSYFKYMSQELFRAANMAERYCETKLAPEEQKVLIDSIEIMMRLSKRDKGSDETLCFGKMLVAEKKKVQKQL